MLNFEVSDIYFSASRLYEGYLEVVFYNSLKQESIHVEGYNEIWYETGNSIKEEYTRIDYPKKKLGIGKKKPVINQIRSSFYNGTFILFDNGDIFRIHLTDIQGEIEEIIRIETPATLSPMERDSIVKMFTKADPVIPSPFRSEE
ncbi:hypothetical protein QNI16_36275 [Cytophagaceae bacterium YF14B1]|uniref:Uncharacterized protein n=1 Tax=Xanthocytophaga flava TaxID=3048013 RepID=A0AAE3QZH2_9BACT|nr:hypothetical protein [Xanthocytophaga flavus]MDJ1485995.1 hypothetical protein [Xanthocytophaga flavus]